MRSSVGTRGAAGSTFDHVAREAGVSRGLLHYYFGSKERLLVEVVAPRLRGAQSRHGRAARQAETVDEIIAALVIGLKEFLEDEAGQPGRDLRDALRVAPLGGDPGRAGRALPAWRAQLAGCAARQGARGRDPARGRRPRRSPRCCSRSATASESRSLSDPDWDQTAAFELGVGIARRLAGRLRLSEPTVLGRRSLAESARVMRVAT